MHLQLRIKGLRLIFKIQNVSDSSRAKKTAAAKRLKELAVLGGENSDTKTLKEAMAPVVFYLLRSVTRWKENCNISLLSWRSPTEYLQHFWAEGLVGLRMTFITHTDCLAHG